LDSLKVHVACISAPVVRFKRSSYRMYSFSNLTPLLSRYLIY